VPSLAAIASAAEVYKRTYVKEAQDAGILRLGDTALAEAISQVRQGDEAKRQELIHQGYAPQDIEKAVEFDLRHVRLGDNKYIPVESFNKLSSKYRRIAVKEGWDALSKAIDADNKAIEELKTKHFVIGNQAMPIKEWNELPEKYQSIAIRENSFEAMNKAIDADNKQLKQDFEALKDYQVPGKESEYYVSDAINAGVSPAIIKRVFGDKAYDDIVAGPTRPDAQADAKKQLEWAHITGDLYRLPDILVSDDPRDREAAEVLFDDASIKRGESWIDKHWGPTERGVLFVKPSTKVSEFWRKITPWKEEKGETIITELSELREKASGMLPDEFAGIAPMAGVVAVAEPTPAGEIILAVLSTGAIAYGALTATQREKVKEKVALSNKAFKATYGRDMTLSDIVLVNEKGQAASLAEILPAVGLAEAQRKYFELPPITKDPDLPKLKGFEQTTERLKEMLKIPAVEGVAVTLPPEAVKVDTKAKEMGKLRPFYPEPTVFIPGIGDMPKELTQAQRFIYGRLAAEEAS